MVPTTPLTWTAFYARHREDEGAIQTLFEEDLQDLVDRTTGHFEQPGKFADTIAGSANANMLIVPGTKGMMNILHHAGFVSGGRDGLALIFVQGNLSDCAYVKVLDRNEATTQAKVTNGRRITIMNCPSLVRMLEAVTADEFANLEAQGNTILRQKPNHVMVHPAVFFIADGAASVRSKELAIAIIDNLRVDLEEDDEEETDKKGKEAAGMELLLATLWASENDGLTAVTLSDIEANPTLNQLIRTVKRKLQDGEADPNPEGEEGLPTTERQKPGRSHRRASFRN